MKKLSGWWRLWIALSLVWVVIFVVALVFSSKSYSASDRKRDAVAEHCIGPVNGVQTDWSSVPAQEISAAMASRAGAPAPQAATPVPPSVAPSADGWGPVEKSGPDSLDVMLLARVAQGAAPNDARTFITSCLEAKQRDYEPDVIRQRRTEIMAYVAVMVAPPLLVLVLGFLVSWVVAGFRKSRDPV